MSLAALSRDDLLAFASQVEMVRRQLAALDHLIVAEFEARGTAREVGARDTADLLVQRLRLSRRVANRRVADAQQLGPRRGLTGEALPPLRPALAAVASGLSDEHVHVALKALDRLPTDAQDDAERFIADKARELEPRQLRIVAQRIVDTLNSDGARPNDAEHQRRRKLWLERAADGSAELSGWLTPEAGIKFQTVLDALSAPAPAADGEPDSRTATQRRHDALIDICDRLLRSGTLPDSGGVATTLVLTAQVSELTGRTEHGKHVDTALTVRLGHDADTYLAVFDDISGRLTLGRRKRCATSSQRRALAARDRGCSFPGCTAPPSWCQSHHILAWLVGGDTDLDNLTLLCGHHHRTFQKAGWQCVMISRQPHWKPPDWLDPSRTPRRNTANHLDDYDFALPTAA